MVEIIIGLIVFLLFLNGLYFHGSIVLYFFSLYIVIYNNLNSLLLPTIIGIIVNFIFLFFVKKNLLKRSLISAQVHKDPIFSRDYNFSVFYFFLFFVIISVNWYQLPWFNLSNFVEARMDFNSSSNLVQRVIKFVFPALFIGLIFKKKYLLFYISAIVFILVEGSKSSIITVFGVILFTNRYYLQIVPIKVTKLISYISVSFLAIASPFILSKGQAFDYLLDRLKQSEVQPYLKLQDVYNSGINYPDFLLNPFQIFFNSLIGNESNIHTSGGNWLTNNSGVSKFEYLLRLFMEGILFDGIPGILFLFLITYFSFYLMRRIFATIETNNTIFFIPLLYIEIISITYRGKLSNSITTYFFTTLLILLIFYVQKKFSFKYK